MDTSTVRTAGTRYRYRTGSTLSGWMTAEELKTHAGEGRVKMDSEIQKAGNDEWYPASKAAALWAPASPGSGEGAGGAEAHDASAHAAAGAAAGAATGAANHGHHGAGGGNGGGNGGVATGAIHHPARIGESIQHLLQRAVLSQVTLSAPEFDAPQRVILAGVTNHDVAFEFESCDSVVYVPYSRLKSVTVPRSYAHSSGRLRGQTELLVIEIEHIPHAVAQAAQTAQA